MIKFNNNIQVNILYLLITLFFFKTGYPSYGQKAGDYIGAENPPALFESKTYFDFFGNNYHRIKNKSFTKAIHLNEQKLKIAEKAGDITKIAMLSNRLGMMSIHDGNNENAIGYFFKSMDAFKQLNDKKGMATTAGEIGYAYQQLKNIDKALQYYYNAYELSKEERLKKVNASVAGLMGIVYLQKKDTVLSEKYFSESLSELTVLNDKKAKSFLLNKIGELYLEKNDFTRAVDYFNQSLLLKQELSDVIGQAIELRNIGIAYFKKGNYEKALENFNKSLTFSNQVLVKKLVKDTYLKLSTVHSFRNEFDQADKYHNLYRELKDSITREESATSLSPGDIEIALTEKEKVIELLNKENEEQTKILNQQGLELSQQLTATEIERQSKEKALEELSLATLEKKEKEKQLLLISKENTEHELQLSKQELELNKKTALTNLLIASSLIILLSLFFTYNRYRYKKKSNEELHQTLEKLKTTQNQLVHSQKMASLGQLTAGIAHEIQNPLNFVNNFSELSIELLTELAQTTSNHERIELTENLKQNLDKISHHGKRADNIVKSMLRHSRSGTHEKLSTDINKLADEFINLAYHGMRATDMNFNCIIETHFDLQLPLIKAVPQDISRVLLNLFNNAFYAVQQRSKTEPSNYEPKVGISTQRTGDKIAIKVLDNGKGIPDAIKDKIFNPFFTTKPSGEGTGIGLSMSYDIIVQGHGGEIKMESKENVGTTFIIELPV